MSEAPERIWVLSYECEDEPDAIAIGYAQQFFASYEYIRADLVEAAVKRALDGAARRLGELSDRFDYNLDDEIQAILELEPAQFVDGET